MKKNGFLYSLLLTFTVVFVSGVLAEIIDKKFQFVSTSQLQVIRIYNTIIAGSIAILLSHSVKFNFTFLSIAARTVLAAILINAAVIAGCLIAAHPGA